jgi:tetratricopeptide (TPR) repeat protein
MGRKHIRARKHILFLVAGLIFLGFSGCVKEGLVQPTISPAGKEEAQKRKAAAVEEKKKNETAKALLFEGNWLFSLGDYDGALRNYQKVIDLLNKKPPADEAYFNIALIHAYPGNPKKNYGQSLAFMKRLITDFPQSSFFYQANVWIDVLQVNEKLTKENEKLVKDHEKTIKDHDRLVKEYEKMNKDYEKLVKDYEKSTKMLEEYKKVDIEIEEKKKEKGR